MHSTDFPEFEPVNRPPQRLADFVHGQVLEAIASGRIAPGVRLVQGVLAEQMDVSRTPVREALLRLEREKILESGDSGGFTVRTITSDDARHIYDVRKAIEGHAARLVAESDDVDDILDVLEPLVVATEKWQPGDDLRQAFAHNDALHRAVVEATRNPVLIEAFDLVWARAQSFIMYAAFIALVEEGNEVHEEGPGHREILGAIAAADGLGAQEMMSGHIGAGLEVQIKALERG